MLQSWQLFLISAAYVGVLFAVASAGDRRAARNPAAMRKPWIYSLALGVYCTSWTFYGAVGRAATSGWDFLPIYLGPALMLTLGGPWMARIIQLSKRHNVTSIADFIGARYGRHPRLAMLVTVIAVLGVLPYIALQLKAVAFGFEVLTGSPHKAAQWDSALVIALLLAAFAILFGTRQIVSSENHPGMVLAIAFESVIKLVAFAAVGIYACLHVFHGFGDAYTQALKLPQMREPLAEADWRAGFAMQTLLAALAMLCLPRQFHVAVVENTSKRDLPRARWVFPLYVAAISAFVVPIAAAGLARLPPGSAADTFVLALPQVEGANWLALAAYLGGFSAGTSMVIVATIALATMLCNELVMPYLLRARGWSPGASEDFGGLIKSVRRIAILALVAAAYLYYRLFTGPGTLASIGLLSFAAVAQFAPALIGGLVWRDSSYRGALIGLCLGFLVWAYTLLLPTLLGSGGAQFLAAGPFGISWLRPQALFGSTGLDALTHGALWSLGLNLACYVLVPLWFAPGLHERLQARRFLDDSSEPAAVRPPSHRITATVGDLAALLERFLGAATVELAFADYAARYGRSQPRREERASAALARHAEHLLAGALGASSARLVLASALRGGDMQFDDVVRLLDETSHEIHFNRELLRATLEHLAQGVSVVDKELRLVAWNRRYVETFGYPAGLVHVGRPIEEIMRYNLGRGLLAPGDPEAQIARRLAHLRQGHSYTHERRLPDGTVIEIRGNPMPGGGFVTSYSDVTAYTRAQAQLKASNENLESRVIERTAALTDANGALAEATLAAERANRAKTRFLAAASHDLVQPLNAARLFVSAIERRELAAAPAQLVAQAENALNSVESLLGALLDISRLDAAAQEVRREHFRLAAVLDPLAAEFAALAQARGLEFRAVATRAAVYSDPRLLRRVLQNLLANAVRYTRHGRVLIGCRHRNGSLAIEVWDTGPGIAPEAQGAIFEEFRRLESGDAGGERGLGLGLAIAERLARLLDHRLNLRSTPGRGSVFSIDVPRGNAPPRTVALPAAHRRDARSFAGLRVLCLDNEPAVLEGMQALLASWDCEVLLARDAEEAGRCCPDAPDLALIDFHLDRGGHEKERDGIEVMRRLCMRWNQDVPGIVITADHTQAARTAAAAHGYALLPKPLKPAALRALMSRLLASRTPPARMAS